MLQVQEKRIKTIQSRQNHLVKFLSLNQRMLKRKWKRKRKNVKERNPGLPLPSSCKSIIERIYLIQRSDKRKEVQVDLQKGVYLVGKNGKRETKLRWESTKTDPVRLIEEFKVKARSKKLLMCADVSTFLLLSSRLKDNDEKTSKKCKIES